MDQGGVKASLQYKDYSHSPEHNAMLSLHLNVLHIQCYQLVSNQAHVRF